MISMNGVLEDAGKQLFFVILRISYAFKGISFFFYCRLEVGVYSVSHSWTGVTWRRYLWVMRGRVTALSQAC